MASESLIIELDARTDRLDRALADTNRRLDDIDSSTRRADSSFSRFTKTAGVAGSALSATATGGLALATALTAVILKSASSQQELNILSRQAKLSTDDFESLAFATKQYGINAEQIGDISKDIADKLGEFGRDATGPFQDFANSAKLSKDEAQALAIEMQDMSSDKVIGHMVSMMEAAGASGNDMTQVMESMGNDLSRLIPLFADGSKQLDGLRGTFKSATEQLKLSTGEIKALQGAATSFDLVTKSLSKAGTLISAQVAPVLSEFFSSVIEEVPTATQTIVNFINSFKDAKNIENLTSIQSELKEKTTDLNIAALELANTEAKLAEAQDPRQRSAYTRMVAEQRVEVEELTSRIDGLTEQEKKLTEQRIADAERLKSVGISADPNDSGTGDQIQAIADRFKSEEDLLREKLEREIGIVGENNELKLQLEQEFRDKLSEIRLRDFDDAINQGSELAGLFEQNKKEESKAANKETAQKRKIEDDYFSAASTLSDAFFADNKALRAGMVVVDAASGISRAFADLPYPAALAASASIAATGVAQLAAIQGATKGGGTVSGGAVAPASSTPETEPTTQLTVSDTDTSGASSSQILSIRIDSDDSELAVALNGILGKAKIDGVIS
jgi:hypothetical protein